MIRIKRFWRYVWVCLAFVLLVSECFAQKTLKSLKVQLQEIQVSDTVLHVLRTTDAEQKKLAPQCSAVMKSIEASLSKNMSKLQSGDIVDYVLPNALIGNLCNIDPKIAESYRQEIMLCEKLSRKHLEKQEKEQKQKEDSLRLAYRNKKKPPVAIEDQLYIEAVRSSETDPEYSLFLLDSLVSQSKFGKQDDIKYEISDNFYYDIVFAKAKILETLNRKAEALLYFEDLYDMFISKRVNFKNARSGEYLLSKILLIQVDIMDTTTMYDYYKKLKNILILKDDDNGGGGGLYAAIRSQTNARKDDIPVSRLHELALEKAAPYCQDLYDKEKFSQYKSVNPYWGKQIPVACFLNQWNIDIEEKLGKPIKHEMRVEMGGSQYEVYVYKTKDGEYEIVYKGLNARSIRFTPMIKQKFSLEELLQYGWQFNILTDCVLKEGYSINSSEGFLLDVYHIRFLIKDEKCSDYSVTFYSKDKKYVQEIWVENFFE